MSGYDPHGLTHEQKVSRLETRGTPVTTTAANIFGSDVARGQRRYIVGILLSNSYSGVAEVTINRVDVSNNSDEWIDSVPIDAEGVRTVPVGGKVPDIDNPCIVLTGGQNLEFDLDATPSGTGAVDVTVWWYDDPLEGA